MNSWIRGGIALVSLLCVACVAPQGENTGWEQRDDGLYYHRGTQRLYDGKFQYTSAGEGFSGNVVGGRREGLFTGTHANGKEKTQLRYHNNQLHGVQRTWFSTGQLRTELDYAQGRFVRGTTYLPDGKEATRAAEGTGQLSAYYENGKVNWEKTWEKGAQVRDRVFDENGDIKVDRWGDKPKGRAP